MGGAKRPLSLKSVTHILQILDTKNIRIKWHTPLVLLTSAFFHHKSANFAISENTNIDCIWYIISNYFDFLWVFKDIFDVVTILMMSGKLATPSLLKIKIFQNKGYDVIVLDHYVTKNILRRDFNYIVCVVMWRKFGNSSISIREVIITSIL